MIAKECHGISDPITKSVFLACVVANNGFLVVFIKQTTIVMSQSILTTMLISD